MTTAVSDSGALQVPPYLDITDVAIMQHERCKMPGISMKLALNRQRQTHVGHKYGLMLRERHFQTPHTGKSGQRARTELGFCRRRGGSARRIPQITLVLSAPLSRAAARTQTPLVCMNSCTLRPAVDSSVTSQRESLKHAGTFEKDLSHEQGGGGKNGSYRGTGRNDPLKKSLPRHIRPFKRRGGEVSRTPQMYRCVF